MRRGYDYATFRTLYAKLRAAMPTVAITTDILVGFCDETEEEHAATLRAQEELRFDSAFTFAYSEREGTTAARKMPDTVSPEVKSRRLAEVIALQQRITGEIMAAQIGRRERILIENPSRRGGHQLMGRTDGFRPVIVPAAGLAPGELVEVTITGATHKTLIGERWRRPMPLPAPDLAQNPFALLSLIAAPAVLTNAASVLALSTSNRFLRASERMRALSAADRGPNA